VPKDQEPDADGYVHLDAHDYYNLKDANGEPYSFTNMPPVEAVSALTRAAFTRAAPRTDGDDGELVERLRAHSANALIDQAADRITALSAEVERLHSIPDRLWAEAQDNRWDSGFNYAVKMFRSALGAKP
jgi:hypothetical protein